MINFLFRTDANECIGMGHVMRCICIAEAMKDVNSIFIVSDMKAYEFITEKGYDVVCLNVKYTNLEKEEIEVIKKISKKLQARNILVDSYYVNEQYLLALTKEFNVGCFNAKDTFLPAKYIINYNVNCDKTLYKRLYNKNNTKLLLGSKYVPLREEFVIKKCYIVKKQVETILVLTGGGDSHNFIETFIRKILGERTFDRIEFTFVMGKYNTRESNLKSLADNTKNIHLVKSVSNIAELMLSSDIVISAGGTTMYELCALGIPTIIFSLADNQTSESRYLESSGVIKFAGVSTEYNFWPNLIKQVKALVENYEDRKIISKRMKKVTDGKGAYRIADYINKVCKNESIQSEANV